MSRTLFLFLFLSILFGTLNAQPTDNPYRSFYPLAPADHWSDSIRWNQVWSIEDFLDSTQVARYNKARDFIAQQGGGVLFYPAGTYVFENSIQFRTGVVIRGAAPSVNVAKDSMFAPPTRFVFPVYIPSDTGLGTSNSTAFKSISALPNTSNAGMVYVDVDRASVSLRSQTFVTVQTPRGSTSQSTEKNRNLILFGIRSNNVAAPYNTVPSVNQHKWQRFSSPFASNLSIYAWKNACIANCRINDFERNGVHPVPNLSFEQPGYLAERTVSGQTIIDTLQGYQAIFSYTDHHGISVNRKATITNATPEEEPGNFCPGLEIRDNWLFKTMRVGIICSGLGIVVDNNQILDRPNKQTWLHPIGSRIATNNAATYENRGIDFGGWNVQITRNDIYVYRHKIYNGPYYSVDGEGILLQECCGGTSVNGARITHNKTHDTYIGLWKVRDVNHVVIDSNETGEEGIILTANVHAGSGRSWYYSVNDCRIAGNICSGIDVDGNRGGRNLLISGNTGSGTSRITAPCFARIEGNSGFSEIRYSAVRDTTWGPTVFTQPCLEDTSRYSSVELISPLAQDTSVFPFNSVPLQVKWQGGQVDSIYFYANFSRLAAFGPGTQTFLYDAGPCNSGVPVNVWASVRDTSVKWETRSAMKQIRVPCITGTEEWTTSGTRPTLFPNPAKDFVFTDWAGPSLRLEIRDMLGRVMVESEGNSPVRVTGIPSGLYSVRLKEGKQNWHYRLLIQR